MVGLSSASLTPTASAPSAVVASKMPIVDTGLLRLLFNIAAVESVREIRAALGHGQLYLWALVDAEADSRNDLIYVAERDFLRVADGYPVDLEVVPLDQVDPRNLPPGETIFSRQDVPSREDHVDQANRNRAHALRLLGEWGEDRGAREWAVTVAFDCGVHCVEAYLADFGLHSHEHRHRAYLLQTAPDPLYAAYRRLQDASRHTRYEIACPDAAYIRDVLLGRYLVAVYALTGVAAEGDT